MIRYGWNSIKDVIKILPGDFEYPANEKEVVSNLKKGNNFILLVYVGGITHAEISAIRYLNRTLKGILVYFLLSIRKEIYHLDYSYYQQ